MPKYKPQVLSRRNLPKAVEHLTQRDSVMAALVQTHGRCLLPERELQPFETLTRSIVSQQLSVKAAQTIQRRVVDLAGALTPAALLAVPPDQLRSAGLSSAKVRYILELSARTADGRLNFGQLVQQPDEEVIQILVDLPGVGRWTAEMFLIFGLRRADVLSLGDAGLQRAARLLYGESARLDVVGEAWRPYRSVASWYLWRHLDNE